MSKPYNQASSSLYRPRQNTGSDGDDVTQFGKPLDVIDAAWLTIVERVMSGTTIDVFDIDTMLATRCCNCNLDVTTCYK